MLIDTSAPENVNILVVHDATTRINPLYIHICQLFPLLLLHIELFYAFQGSILLIVSAHDVAKDALRMIWTFSVGFGLVFNGQKVIIWSDAKELTRLIHLKDFSNVPSLVNKCQIRLCLFALIKAAYQKESLLGASNISILEFFGNSLHKIFSIDQRKFLPIVFSIFGLTILKSGKFDSIKKNKGRFQGGIILYGAHFFDGFQIWIDLFELTRCESFHFVKVYLFTNLFV